MGEVQAEVLIATLGTEAQVVTLSLLELERLDFGVSEVVVVHTAAKRDKIRESIERLDEAFADDPRLSCYHYRRELLQGERGPIADVTTAAEAEMVFETLYRVVRRYKLTGCRVHLNVAGGRKPMSIYGMVTAQILFDADDHLWHLVSDDALVESRRLFPEPGDRYSLVPVPVIRWTDRSPLEAGLAQAETPQEALREQETLRRDMQVELFLKGDLTPAEREVAHLLAQGLSNEAIAAHRGTEMNTVTKQVSAVYGKWRTFFGLEGDAPVRDAVVAEMARYWARREDGRGLL
jgi:CRISPR-associated Csx14 family protein